MSGEPKPVAIIMGSQSEGAVMRRAAKMLLAAGVLALSDPALAGRLEAWRADRTAAVAERPQDAPPVEGPA